MVGACALVHVIQLIVVEQDLVGLAFNADAVAVEGLLSTLLP